VSRRGLILTGLAGLAVLIPALAVPFMGHPKANAPINVLQYVAYDIAGGSFLIVGWIAAWRRPNSRIGLLMMAVGLVWFLGQIGWIPESPR
jgi:hypothetical protein